MKTQQFLDKQNIRRINHTPIGQYTTITSILDNGQMKSYESLVVENERSILMSNISKKSKCLRFNEDVLNDLLSSDTDDGFVADDEQEKDK